MTQAERQSVIFAAFAAIRRLVPKRSHSDLELHLAAVTAAFNDQIDAAYQRGKADGLLAMESREDRRDLAVIEAPAELRSVH